MNTVNQPAYPSGDMMGREPSGGMTLRDYFAGQALPAIIAAACAGQHSSGLNNFASDAYDIADRMLAEREIKP